MTKTQDTLQLKPIRKLEHWERTCTKGDRTCGKRMVSLETTPAGYIEVCAECGEPRREVETNDCMWKSFGWSTQEQPLQDVKQSAFRSQVNGNHYKDMAIQPIEFCQKNELNFCESNVIKYVCRHRRKNGAQDIKKAIHNLQLLLEMEYPNEA